MQAFPSLNVIYEVPAGSVKRALTALGVQKERGVAGGTSVQADQGDGQRAQHSES